MWHQVIGRNLPKELSRKRLGKRLVLTLHVALCVRVVMDGVSYLTWKKRIEEGWDFFDEETLERARKFVYGGEEGEGGGHCQDCVDTLVVELDAEERAEDSAALSVISEEEAPLAGEVHQPMQRDSTWASFMGAGSSVAIPKVVVVSDPDTDEGGDSQLIRKRKKRRLSRSHSRDIDVEAVKQDKRHYPTELAARLAVEGQKDRPPLRILCSKLAVKEETVVRYCCGNRSCPYQVDVFYDARRAHKGKTCWTAHWKVFNHTCPHVDEAAEESPATSSTDESTEDETVPRMYVPPI